METFTHHKNKLREQKIKIDSKKTLAQRIIIHKPEVIKKEDLRNN